MAQYFILDTGTVLGYILAGTYHEASAWRNKYAPRASIAILCGGECMPTDIDRLDD